MELLDRYVRALQQGADEDALRAFVEAGCDPEEFFDRYRGQVYSRDDETIEPGDFLEADGYYFVR